MGAANDYYSSLIHLLSAAGFLIAAPVLLQRLGRDPLRLFGGFLHVFGVLFLFVMSGTFHMCEHLWGAAHPTTESFRQLDHVGVWVLMGAFHTLPILLLLEGAWRWVTFSVIWGAALTGIAMKTFWWGMFTLGQSFVLYAAASLVGVILIGRLIHQYGVRFNRPLFVFWGCFVAAAAAFVGQPPDLIPGVIGQHELWHLGITGGAIAHWYFVLREATRTASQPTELTVRPLPLPARAE